MKKYLRAPLEMGFVIPAKAGMTFRAILTIILMLISLCTITTSYADQQTFKDVQQQLAQANNISGQFVQIRNIKLLSQPLKSAGNFTLSKANGLQWDQTQPFKSTLQLTASKLTQQIGDNPPTVITKQQQPIVFFFAKTFLSVFRGNTKDLTPYFNIKFSGTVHNWTINLTAKTAPLNKAIKKIKLSGGKYVKSAVIEEATGDTLTIRFSNIHV